MSAFGPKRTKLNFGWGHVCPLMTRSGQLKVNAQRNEPGYSYPEWSLLGRPMGTNASMILSNP
jgi:hypothetical protein